MGKLTNAEQILKEIQNINITLSSLTRQEDQKQPALQEIDNNIITAMQEDINNNFKEIGEIKIILKNHIDNEYIHQKETEEAEEIYQEMQIKSGIETLPKIKSKKKDDLPELL